VVIEGITFGAVNAVLYNIWGKAAWVPKSIREIDDLRNDE
jgi:hypothetical protein